MHHPKALGRVELRLGRQGIGPSDVLQIDRATRAVQVETPHIASGRWQARGVWSENGKGKGDLSGPERILIRLLVECALYVDGHLHALAVP